jgi:hypothetical protein
MKKLISSVAALAIVATPAVAFAKAGPSTKTVVTKSGSTKATTTVSTKGNTTTAKTTMTKGSGKAAHRSARRTHKMASAKKHSAAPKSAPSTGKK